MDVKIYPSGPIDTNAYLISCPKTKLAWIIDAPLGCVDSIKHDVVKNDLRVEKIILTHSHWDHIADLSKLKNTFEAKVLINKLDSENVVHPGSDGLDLYFPIQGVNIDEYLENDQLLSLGNILAKVIHTPGHSMGSICLFFPEEKVLISGDTLFKGSMGRIDLPTSSPEKMWSSLKLLSLLPDETKVYPGHGHLTKIGNESWMKNAKEFFS